MKTRFTFHFTFHFRNDFRNLFGKDFRNFDDAGAREVQSLLHGVVPARVILAAPKEEEA